MQESQIDSPEVKEVQTELAGMAAEKKLRPEIAMLMSRVEFAAESATSLADAAVAAAPEIVAVPEIARALADAYRDYEKLAAAITTNRPDLTEQGKNAEILKLAATRDSKTAAAESRLNDALQRFEAKNVEPFWPAPSPEIVAEVGLLFQSFPHESAAGFAKRASDTLRRASDPATPNPEKFRLNQLLAHGFGPLVERRSAAPERHALPLAGVSGQLSEAIATHLNNVLGRAKYNATRAKADAIRSEWEFAKSTAAKVGKFDDFVIRIGASTLFGQSGQ